MFVLKRSDSYQVSILHPYPSFHWLGWFGAIQFCNVQFIVLIVSNPKLGW